MFGESKVKKQIFLYSNDVLCFLRAYHKSSLNITACLLCLVIYHLLILLGNSSVMEIYMFFSVNPPSFVRVFVILLFFLNKFALDLSAHIMEDMSRPSHHDYAPCISAKFLSLLLQWNFKPVYLTLAHTCRNILLQFFFSWVFDPGLSMYNPNSPKFRMLCKI